MRKSLLRSCLTGGILCLCVALLWLLCLPLSASAAGTNGMITIELSDSYGDGWSDNAIEVYADGELLGIATMDDGASATWTIEHDSHMAYEFRWINGIYSQETSFVIYVGTEKVVSASGYDYGGGATILSLEKECSAANYVSGVCTNCGTSCTHRLVGKEGACVDCGYVCPGHNWVDGVCSVCSGACLHQTYSAGSCQVCGKKMILSIELKDEYSDGWSGNAINIYADGTLLDTITIDSGFHGAWDVEYINTATYTFEWVTGNYPEECSFRILLSDKLCYEAMPDDCGTLANGVFYTLEPWCDHPSYDSNYCCTSCGRACSHVGIEPKGTCGSCGFTCGSSASHVWDQDTCQVCGLVCHHTNWTDSVCDDCGFVCGSDAAHSFDAAQACTRCDLVCGTTAPHAWEHGSCTICGLSCSHESWTGFVCDSCSFTCGTDAAHSFDADHACSVCGFICGTTADHAWHKGNCTVCDLSCQHQNCTNGVCAVCDYYQPAVHNGVGENGFALYEIYNAGQLLWFADYVNSNEVLSRKTILDTETNESFYFEYTSGCVNGKLMADIDMSGLLWTAIGTPHISNSISRNSYGYAGSFDGNGHVVRGVNCNTSSNDSMVYAGFFGAVCGGNIRNLTVYGNIHGITGTDYYPAAYAGGIAGYVCEWYDYTGETIDTRRDLPSGITNCTFIGNVSVSAKDQEYAGGIVGIASGTSITNCLSAVTVSATEAGDYYVGSLCGCVINDCVITNCWYDSTLSTKGEVNGEDYAQVTGMSTEHMALGGAAHALGFGQTLGVDTYPGYGDDPVYQITTGCYTYSNIKPTAVTEKQHTGGACIGQAVCADCRMVYGEDLGHRYVGGKCENCGDTKIVSLPGDFNEWTTEEMTWTAGGYTFTMELAAGTYRFKLIKDDIWLGNNGTIVDTTTATSNVGWEFADWGGDCVLVATGGTYYFNFNYDTNMLVITAEHIHNYSGGKCVGCGDTKIVSLPGDFNEWTTEEMTWTASGYTFTMELAAGTYKFKLIKDGIWLGNNGTIVDTTTATSNVGWEFADWGGDCILVATGGTYYFNFNFDTNMLVITYVHAHEYKAGDVVAPTCENEGYTVYTCACGDSYNSDKKASLGHNHSGKVTTAATCTTEGVKTFTCSRCDDTYTESISKLNHDYKSTVTAPTCTEQGYTTYACSRCSDSYKDNYVNALTHSYSETITKAPTCTETGVKTFTCSNCSHSYTESIPILGHSYESVVTAPTCTEAGYTTYTCSVCGDSYVADEVAALGHSWIDATCTTAKTCSVCGVTEGESAGHSYEAVVTAPTCTAQGYTTHTCSVCGDSYVDSYVDATGHSFTDGICTGCGCYALQHTGASLTLENEIKYNLYFYLNDSSINVADVGLLTFLSEPTDATLANADHVLHNLFLDAKTGYYALQSQGVAAKNMADAMYLRLYVELEDGTVIYGKLINYSAQKYTDTVLAMASSSETLKNVVVALMNYGAEAQKRFNYNTDSLMNAHLTAEQQAGQVSYSADLLDARVKAADSKIGSLIATDGAFSTKSASVTLEGALKLNFFFLPGKTVDNGTMTMYYWTASTYASVDELTLDNADGSMAMTMNGSYYQGVYDDIAAKEIDNTVYVLAVYESEGETCMSGIVSYSIEHYCRSEVTNQTANQAVCEALTIYSYLAKIYFKVDQA